MEVNQKIIMKMRIVLLAICFLIVLVDVKAQNASTIPMYENNFPTARKLLDKKIWDLFAETKQNGFVVMSFTVIESGSISDLTFSKNFPKDIVLEIERTFHADPKKWSPAIFDHKLISKKIILPILYQYGGIDNFTLDMNMILDGLDFRDATTSRTGIVDAIIMPVCQTGFEKR